MAELAAETREKDHHSVISAYPPRNARVNNTHTKGSLCPFWRQFMRIDQRQHRNRRAVKQNDFLRDRSP